MFAPVNQRESAFCRELLGLSRASRPSGGTVPPRTKGARHVRSVGSAAGENGDEEDVALTSCVGGFGGRRRVVSCGRWCKAPTASRRHPCRTPIALRNGCPVCSTAQRRSRRCRSGSSASCSATPGGTPVWRSTERSGVRAQAQRAIVAGARVRRCGRRRHRVHLRRRRGPEAHRRPGQLGGHRSGTRDGRRPRRRPVAGASRRVGDRPAQRLRRGADGERARRRRRGDRVALRRGHRADDGAAAHVHLAAAPRRAGWSGDRRVPRTRSGATPWWSALPTSSATPG